MRRLFQLLSSDHIIGSLFCRPTAFEPFKNASSMSTLSTCIDPERPAAARPVFLTLAISLLSTMMKKFFCSFRRQSW